MGKANTVSPLKFSNHAVDRMQFRGVTIEPETLERISTAVDNAKAKGAKEDSCAGLMIQQ